MERPPPFQNISGKGWNHLPTLDDIVKFIKELPLDEVLKYLLAVGIKDFVKEGYSRIKKEIQDRFNEEMYAFVPDKEEANLLLSFKEHPHFRQVQLLVPNYRYIDIIRTGILINYYHENDSPENREKVEGIKRNLIKRPNGNKLLKIVNLPTTPFFDTILELLYDLKSKGYSDANLEEAFDEIVERWEKITMLVKNTDKVDDVAYFCERHIYDNADLFIICGMKTASSIVEKALEKLQEDDFLYERGYTGLMTKSIYGNNPRTQIMFLKASNSI